VEEVSHIKDRNKEILEAITTEEILSAEIMPDMIKITY